MSFSNEAVKKLLTTISDTQLQAFAIPRIPEDQPVMSADYIAKKNPWFEAGKKASQDIDKAVIDKLTGISANVAIGYNALTGMLQTQQLQPNHQPRYKSADQTREQYVLQECWSYERVGISIPYFLYRLALLATQLFPSGEDDSFMMEYSSECGPHIQFLYWGKGQIAEIRIQFWLQACDLTVFNRPGPRAGKNPDVSRHYEWQTMGETEEENLLCYLLDSIWEDSGESHIINIRAHSIVDQFVVDRLPTEVSFGVFFWLFLVYSNLAPHIQKRLAIGHSNKNELTLISDSNVTPIRLMVTPAQVTVAVTTASGNCGTTYVCYSPMEKVYEKVKAAANELTRQVAAT